MENNYRDKEQDNRIKSLEDHFITINSEMGAIQADVKWLKWWTKLMIGSQILIILALVKLLIK